MAKTRENHRNKKKAPKVYVELDLKQFNDILKPKESKFKGKKDNRGKNRDNRNNKPHNDKGSKPYHKDKQGNNNNRNGKPKYNGKPNQNKPKQPK
jgi:hypothetical protein